MRTLLRYAARLYPKEWRDRYAAEFDALLDDISPAFADLCNILGNVLRVRATSSMGAGLLAVTASPGPVRMPVVASVTAHALMISLFLLASWNFAIPMPMRVAVAPLPPPAPDPPPQITDARVFPDKSTLYSSLPLQNLDTRGTLRTYVANGVGINFLPLPDIGAAYREGNTEARVWPGQALEGFLVRRVLPEYPRGIGTEGAVSVFVEFRIAQDGSVRVLRTSGPAPFTSAAQSAIEHWVYRSLWFENHPIDVISRVEVRFDGEFAERQRPN
jgi:hypothetical protein